MLLEFSVGNYLSFKSKTTLMATAIKEQVDTNIFSSERYDLLKGAVIYGANASGKSNFIRAMSTMRRLMLQSFEQSSADELDITPFLLSTESEHEPAFFELVFLIDDIRYRYGFEVGEAFELWYLLHFQYYVKRKCERLCDWSNHPNRQLNKTRSRSQ